MEDAPIKLEPLRKKRTSRKQRSPTGLAARRERNGVSLHDIAERTRIPLRHLEELERGDISQWPAGVYAKSWAREYAEEAGIDPEEVAALVGPVAAVEPSIEEIKQVREAAEKRVQRVRRVFESHLLARLAAVAVVLALLVLAGVFIARYEPERRGVPVADPAGTGGRPVGTSGVSPEAPR
jgi:cytoskeleton protein RodZ